MKELELLEIGIKELRERFHRANITRNNEFCTPKAKTFMQGKISAYDEVLELIEHIDSLKALKEVKNNGKNKK